jgi:Fe2+ or Zn2+ uptake regulation protein
LGFRYISLGFAMNELPEKIQDLVSTPGRLKIVEAMASLEDTFTIQDVYTQLQRQGSYIRIASVQTLLRGLCYRGYLEQFAIKKGTSRGRSTIHFKKK